MTLNPNEWKRKNDLKLFENQGAIKNIWKKTGIWKLEFYWSFENYLKIGILKIKFKNWSFENYLKNRALKIEVLKIKSDNWNFRKFNFDIKRWRILPN